MTTYNDIIRRTLKITPERARLVEAYLRLDYGTLDHLSNVEIRREYHVGGISAAIDADVDGALKLAESLGLK